MRTALVVIDVQNGFINDRTKNIPEKIAGHIKKTKYDYVLFTQFVNHEDSNFHKLIGWKHVHESPEIDICKQLQPFITEGQVFQKTSYSAFKASNFTKFLTEHDITQLFLCGLDADSCVLASAFEAFDLGYDVKVLTDLIECGNKRELYDFTVEVLKNNIQKNV